jgi:hypothetical protein
MIRCAGRCGYSRAPAIAAWTATLALVACPRCLHLESANDDLDFVLLLEDLAPARQGDQLAGASIRQIETALALRNKAGLSAGDELKRWGYATVEYEIVR